MTYLLYERIQHLKYTVNAWHSSDYSSEHCMLQRIYIRFGCTSLPMNIGNLVNLLPISYS